MRNFMHNKNIISVLTTTILLGLTCLLSPVALAVSAPAAEQIEPEKGSHNGRLLRDGEFAIELALFETGVPPEFRVWVTDKEQPISPDKVDLNIKLTRLGGRVNDIQFIGQDDFLRGDKVIYEPHSFEVSITATYQGKTHQWNYDNFEGRTTIDQAVADAMEIKTAVVSAVTIRQTIPVYGTLVLPPDANRIVTARFAGEIKQLHVKLGDNVKKGQLLLTVESNESLKSFQITAPANGTITAQQANAGEQTAGRTLLIISNTSSYIAQLAVYPTNYTNVSVGAPVTLNINGYPLALTGNVAYIEPSVREDQARLVWVYVEDTNRQLTTGSFVKAAIEIAKIDVPLAVKRIGLQAFRDFTVVYAKVGEQYEVRMLELGRQDNVWVEVLGGLEPGTEYVSENSYIIKADIEKSGASHDH
jgi:cobalt-zinc-cadmium efflux system membrane fusion protein